MKRILCRASILLAGLFSGSAAFAAGALEIPQPNSGQSGVSIVSGWHCNASRIEVSFDGGPKIGAAYGTTRADTKGPCGDENNGFSLLWAYGLLGSGTHEVVAYADGVEFGRSVFQVTDIANKGFLTGKASARRVYGFPDLDHDVILKWQEANQNYVISNIVESMDSYDISGYWEVFDGSTITASALWFTFPTSQDPRIGQVIVETTEIIGGDFFSVTYAGAMTKNMARLTTNPNLGASVTAEIEVVFTGPRSGTITLTKCSPSFDCPYPVGHQQRLQKLYPSVEDAALPSSISGDSNGEVAPMEAMSPIEEAMQEMREQLIQNDNGFTD